MTDRQTPNIAAAGDALMASLAPTLPTPLEAELSDKLAAARRRIEALERENERLRSDLALLSERTARLMEAAVNDYRAGVVVSEASR